MYHALVRRATREAFAALSAGDFERLLARASPDLHHVFPGVHPLGGERHTREGAERWFARLAHLFPGHAFVVERIVVRGGPWSTWVSARWTAELRPRDGTAYANDGTHWLHLRWGRLVALHAYLDTQAVARACAEMAARGISEADASPILD